MKRWLRLFDLAMQVEDIPPEKRDRVRHWLLFGASPDRDLSEVTTELLPAEVRFNQGHVPDRWLDSDLREGPAIKGDTR